MKKAIYIIGAVFLFGLTAKSQPNEDEKKEAIRKKIEKAVKDPEREKKSAKADVRIFEKKTIKN